MNTPKSTPIFKKPHALQYSTPKDKFNSSMILISATATRDQTNQKRVVTTPSSRTTVTPTSRTTVKRGLNPNFVLEPSTAAMTPIPSHRLPMNMVVSQIARRKPIAHRQQHRQEPQPDVSSRVPEKNQLDPVLEEILESFGTPGPKSGTLPHPEDLMSAKMRRYRKLEGPEDNIQNAFQAIYGNTGTQMCKKFRLAAEEEENKPPKMSRWNSYAERISQYGAYVSRKFRGAENFRPAEPKNSHKNDSPSEDQQEVNEPQFQQYESENSCEPTPKYQNEYDSQINQELFETQEQTYEPQNDFESTNQTYQPAPKHQNEYDSQINHGPHEQQIYEATTYQTYDESTLKIYDYQINKYAQTPNQIYSQVKQLGENKDANNYTPEPYFHPHKMFEPPTVFNHPCGPKPYGYGPQQRALQPRKIVSSESFLKPAFFHNYDTSYKQKTTNPYDSPFEPSNRHFVAGPNLNHSDDTRFESRNSPYLTQPKPNYPFDTPRFENRNCSFIAEPNDNRFGPANRSFQAGPTPTQSYDTRFETRNRSYLADRQQNHYDSNRYEPANCSYMSQPNPSQSYDPLYETRNYNEDSRFNEPANSFFEEEPQTNRSDNSQFDTRNNSFLIKPKPLRPNDTPSQGRNSTFFFKPRPFEISNNCSSFHGEPYDSYTFEPENQSNSTLLEPNLYDPTENNFELLNMSPEVPDHEKYQKKLPESAECRWLYEVSPVKNQQEHPSNPRGNAPGPRGNVPDPRETAPDPKGNVPDQENNSPRNQFKMRYISISDIEASSDSCEDED